MADLGSLDARIRWLKVNPDAFDRVTDTYWTVRDESRRDVGAVLDTGTTRDMRFKAISPLRVADNPDTAPGVARGPSKEFAAAYLFPEADGV